MAIIKPGSEKSDLRIISFPSKKDSDSDEIPFILATDLIAEEEIPAEDIAAIAMALTVALPHENEGTSLWGTTARLHGISQRPS